MEKVLDIFKKKYDCIFSLGILCFNAELLTKAKLRTFSSPFDWLCGGDFVSRTDLLCNKFEDFLNIEDLEKIGEREYPETCDIYENKKNNLIFNHDFPKGENLSSAYDSVSAKYNKRISRLYEKLNKAKHSLIIFMDVDNNFIEDELAISTITRINKALNKNNIDLLLIRHNFDLKDNDFKIKQLSNNAFVADIYNIRRDNDGMGNFKNCNNILSKIKLRKSFNEMLLKIAKGRTRIRVYLFGIKIMSFKLKG